MSKELVDTWKALGEWLCDEEHPEIQVLKEQALAENSWFTIENVGKAIKAIGAKMLSQESLDKFMDHYKWETATKARNIGLISAGNIPLVGFHDLFCILTSGHNAFVKCSSKDSALLKGVRSKLIEINPTLENRFQLLDQLKGMDAYIATGSNNTARYFESYFGAFPHVIRRNRNSVAVLTGEESEEELILLGEDVFSYFGLGCRNVSSLMVPEQYDFAPALTLWQEHFISTIFHNGYKNNYDYNYALHLMNKVPFLMNGCIQLLESDQLPSRIACLHYSIYDDLNSAALRIEGLHDQIQVVVSSVLLNSIPIVPFGQSQQPGLLDYPDGVDTYAFLLNVG
jgi:hypothetical protein